MRRQRKLRLAAPPSSTAKDGERQAHWQRGHLARGILSLACRLVQKHGLDSVQPFGHQLTGACACGVLSGRCVRDQRPPLCRAENEAPKQFEQVMTVMRVKVGDCVGVYALGVVPARRARPLRSMVVAAPPWPLTPPTQPP
eukprot:903789-Prymnesium_polylepis.1